MTIAPSNLTVTKRCIRLIQDYWAERGYVVQVDYEAIKPHGEERSEQKVYPITSDLVNGLPTRSKVRRAA